MKLTKKLMLSGAALIMATPLAINYVSNTVQADDGNASTVTEMLGKGTLKISSPYARPYGVRLFNIQGKYTNIFSLYIK